MIIKINRWIQGEIYGHIDKDGYIIRINRWIYKVNRYIKRYNGHIVDVLFVY